jgi:hypothetical protein
MLAINPIAKMSMVTFAVKQDSLKPRTSQLLRIRKTFNMQVNNKARMVPKIQILPV